MVVMDVFGATSPCVMDDESIFGIWLEKPTLDSTGVGVARTLVVFERNVLFRLFNDPSYGNVGMGVVGTNIGCCCCC